MYMNTFLIWNALPINVRDLKYVARGARYAAILMLSGVSFSSCTVCIVFTDLMCCQRMFWETVRQGIFSAQKSTFENVYIRLCERAVRLNDTRGAHF